MTQINAVNPLTGYDARWLPDLARIDHYLAHWASKTPDGEAAIEGSKILSYAALARHVDAVTSRLQQLGLKDGDVMAVLIPPSVDFLILFLAGHRLGVTWLGLNPKYTRAELAQVVADAQPRIVFARQKISGRDYTHDLETLARESSTGGSGLCWLDAPQLDPIRFSVLRLDALDNSPESSNPSPQTVCNEIAALVYTSGSTGHPKAAQLSHRALIKGARVRATVWRVQPMRAISNVPINHVGALGDLACTVLVCGGTQVFLQAFSAQGTLDAISRHKLTYWYQAPTMFEMCLNAPEAAHTDWSHLQAAIWSGGRASESLIARLSAVAPRLGVDYSMTESVGAITLSELTSDAMQLRDNVGWPDPDRSLRIADAATNEPVAHGETGEVQIKDEWMFSGYRNPRAGATAAFSVDGWFKTGDMVKITAHGAWQIVGRCKEMFKSGGYNVYPREVEQRLESHTGVREVAVLEMPDSLYGEVGVAFVSLRHLHTSQADLVTHCRQELANYKIPKRFIFLDALPMLPIGKVDKPALRAMLASQTLPP
jgi:acyl-CoA synthetase (AMP-forming)/AMP-acid ligase II